jgi:hypothetical protein
LLNALQQQPHVYVSGGYQTPDIILTNLATNVPVPIGGAPGGPWDTLLKPNTAYGFAVNVHNDSAATANNIAVSFWAIPGGAGTNGSMVGTPQTVSIPPYSYVKVNASANFMSAANGDHLCAVVSLYNPSAGCAVDATTALLIPDPGVAGSHSCSAWRNTDSSMAASGSKFQFGLGLGKLNMRELEPIQLQFNQVHVPANWTNIAKVREIGDLLKFVGSNSNYPLYLLPEIQRLLGVVDVKLRPANVHGGKVEESGPGGWQFHPSAINAEASFEVTGEIPPIAAKGDLILVNITAKYPKIAGRAARSIGFLEVIHIK